MNVSICTYSMNRLKHAKQSVPQMLSVIDDNDEVILIDYNCREKTGEWALTIKDPRLKVFIIPHLEGTIYYNTSHARNCACQCASKEMLIFLDIDGLLQKEMLEEIRNLQNNQYFRFGNGRNQFGECAIWKSDLLKCNGYEEAFAGYGFEDEAMYNTLQHVGLEEIFSKYQHKFIHLNGDDDWYLTCDSWSQNKAIYDILKHKSQFINNVYRNWGCGAMPLDPQ